MKTIFKGMVLLLAGASFVACSKDVSFDENAQKQAEEAQKEAEIAQKFATYRSEFVKTFGAIASDQDWGFGQASGITTRGSLGGNGSSDAVDCGFIVPDDITDIKNGVFANTAQAKFKNGQGVDIDQLNKYANYDFNYYWLQHFNTANGLHSLMKSVEAYDATAGKWIAVANFKDGKNESETYFKVNSSSHGTTLMMDMGGKAGDPAEGPSHGKLFRWVDGNGGYHYDYKFLEFYHKQGQKTREFLVLGLKSPSNNNWWLIKIVQAEPKDPNNLVVEEGRILCEDLGDTKDFDFNDVVFDAKRYYNGTIKIKLLAAGGTLPITVAGESVKERLGSMKNTGVGEPVDEYEFEITDGSIKRIIDIPIIVNSGDEAATYQLEAPVGGAPQKICTPINTHWPEEYVSIRDAYSEFNKWVNEKNPKLWIWVENTLLTDYDLNTK